MYAVGQRVAIHQTGRFWEKAGWAQEDGERVPVWDPQNLPDREVAGIVTAVSQSKRGGMVQVAVKTVDGKSETLHLPDVG